jgi:hypothetical protein
MISVLISLLEAGMNFSLVVTENQMKLLEVKLTKVQGPPYPSPHPL